MRKHGLLVRVVALWVTALVGGGAAGGVQGGGTAGGVVVGAERTDVYAPLLAGRRVALLSNHTGVLADGSHTLDAMLAAGIDVVRLLSPEHGFRGTADAGEHVAATVDAATGLPIVSLYVGGRTTLPAGALDGIDAVVVDLQDVGARFYTYHITMIKAMEGAARAGVPVVVLDRPNPLGWIVDGPLLDVAKLRSGVGRLPIPAVHGMTMGELAIAANSEGWLDDGLRCELTVVPCQGYTHSTRYELPVAPSPNLRTTKAIGLYPSLCLLEGTTVSVGRGTDAPFTLYGHPDMEPRGFTFTPRSMPGAKQPPWLGRECQGVDLGGLSDEEALATGFDPTYLIDAYRHTHAAGGGGKFFNKLFDLLAGTTELRRMVAAGASAEAIRATWQADLARFRTLRARYLLYPL